jgi:hypothetical protein
MTRDAPLSAQERLSPGWTSSDGPTDDPVAAALAAFATAMAKEPMPARLQVLLERLRAEETR